MRIGIAVDYGKIPNASSLDLVGREMFRELGNLMNKNRTFTIAALKYDNIGLGDVNIHYDCISIPNMGGFRMPHERALSAKNLCLGIAGIDEVILKREVHTSDTAWEKTQSQIPIEVAKWSKKIDKIKFIHVPSESEKNQIIKHLKIPTEKIHVIPHGVNKDFFKPSSDIDKTRTNILGKLYIKDVPYFLHVGETNWARKNVIRMLDAFKIAKKHGVKHHLIIVGRYDPIIEKKGKQIPDVHVLGYVSDEVLRDLLQNAYALLFPSLHEGFGLPLVEAMACGTPSITSNVFSPPEVVGDAGILVDPYDVNDIANKIVELAKNEELRETLSSKCHKNVEKFDWSKSAKMLLELIRQKCNFSNTFDFEYSYDVSAYRTIVTACELTPTFYYTVIKDLLQFDYSKIISWALTEGLYDAKVGPLLFPFKKWLEENESKI